MTYSQALAYISSLAPRGWRLGLDRMEELCRRANLYKGLGAEGGPQYIHVAGTNGKGSTTAYLQSILVEQGYRTGAFFSPYVIDPRERVQFGRNLIAEQELVDLVLQLQPAAESFSEKDFGGVTEFEFKTALGFSYWIQKQCEWVALEVGLGGRLDATNVVTPRSTAIVSIGLDHTSILGNTYAQIAIEKAGIVKEGIPLVVGNVPPEALEVITRIAQEMSAPLWRIGQEIQFENTGSRQISVSTPSSTYLDLRVGLPGAMQDHNLALAVAAAEASGAIINPDAVKAGAANASIPGRFQKVLYQGKTFILDGSHNEEAARVLRQSLLELIANEDRPPKIRLVTNMLSGHDPVGFYKEIADLVQSVEVVPIDFFRALPVEEAVAELKKLMPAARGHASINEAITTVCSESSDSELIVVTGSNYVVGEVARLILR